MKNLFLLLSLFLSFSASAKDMSRTENYDDVYKESADGSLKYIGGCSVHQDMSEINFLEKETLVDYIDLSDNDTTREDFLKKVSNIEIELINAAEFRVGTEMPMAIDDFLVQKIESLRIKGLNLYRLNIGVGGGNGMYLIYNRTISNEKISYELMAEIFDGDVEYCDSQVWLSK